jgi:tRNA (cytosine38-C5)-methyltransferase
MPHLKYLEFYAGIGGWNMALQKAVTKINQLSFSNDVNCSTDHDTSNDTTSHVSKITTECCGAFDHSDLCTMVYEHNFVSSSDDQHRGITVDHNTTKQMKAIRIEKLTVSDMIQQYSADIWMMSPPCQPHTRQHTNQLNDMNDSRSNSFLHLCQLLRDIQTTDGTLLPSIVLLENVVGFEKSNSCNIWIETLLQCKYRIAQFILQPIQVGVPNDRPRYYCVAVHCDKFKKGKNGNKSWVEHYFSTPSILDSSIANHETSENSTQREKTESNLVIHTTLEELEVIPESKLDLDSLPTLVSFLDDTLNADQISELLISETFLQRPAAWCLDIVTSNSRRTSCFTSSYGKYAKGTGSVLLLTSSQGTASNTHIDKKFKLLPPEKRQYDPKWMDDLKQNGYTLRYFSGNELIRLFGFTDTFTFPTNITIKQQWKLIGNSLNVTLTAKIIELALRSTM